MKRFILGIPAFIILLCIVGLVAAGCGASSTGEYSVMPATTTTYLATKGDVTSENLRNEYGLDKPGIFGSGSKGGTPSPTVTLTQPQMTKAPAVTQSSAGIPVERMVIKTASMALVVEDVNNALQQITSLASANGGYVINSNIREDKSKLYGNISFRVESAKFDDTLNSLRNLSVDVRSESTSGQDVTEEYIDLDAKLRNLEASEAQLLVLMDKAGTVEEILKVQQQLTSTRSEIEQIKGRMQYLQQSSSLSSISASLEQSKLVVEFNASSSSVKEGGNIRFYPSLSGGFEPYTFEWNFGDGGTSTESSPLHSYKKKGSYTVTLNIKDDKGNTAFAERKAYITVLSGWEAGNTVRSAWNGLVSFGRFLGAFFIWLGVLSPIWIVILVILYFAWWRRRKKKA